MRRAAPLRGIPEGVLKPDRSMQFTLSVLSSLLQSSNLRNLFSARQFPQGGQRWTSRLCEKGSLRVLLLIHNQLHILLHRRVISVTQPSQVDGHWTRNCYGQGLNRFWSVPNNVGGEKAQCESFEFADETFVFDCLLYYATPLRWSICVQQVGITRIESFTFPVQPPRLLA